LDHKDLKELQELLEILEPQDKVGLEVFRVILDNKATQVLRDQQVSQVSLEYLEQLDKLVRLEIQE